MPQDATAMRCEFAGNIGGAFEGNVIWSFVGSAIGDKSGVVARSTMSRPQHKPHTVPMVTANQSGTSSRQM
jgi:hypothetical protein